MNLAFGTDISIFPDIDLTFTVIIDYEQVLLEDAYKKLTTRPGYLNLNTNQYTGQYWDTNTLDLRDYLGSNMNESIKDRLINRIYSVFEKELRYSVIVQADYFKEILYVRLDIYPNNNLPVIQVIFTVDGSEISFERVN